MPKHDEIRIENLECFAFHGVKPFENELGQFFYVSTVLYTDIRDAALGDDLELTVNYSTVAKYINELMKKETCKLIETVAEKMARNILLKFPLVKSLDLEIRKPNAPIGLNFTSVSVKINRGWHEVYVATGSNLGESESLINNAVTKIRNHPHIRAVKASKLINSLPYGVNNQPDFKNGAVTFLTLLTPFELLSFLQGLEKEAGRCRDGNENIRWGARTLDLDILLYGDEAINEENLVIPHPDLHNRDFVLIPLISLNPHLLHPTLNRGMKQLLLELTENYVN
ncbi:MAG: 2-amino-4-hydroxy-6-hydroxymethyldihydropteridine diphosphokinase [Lachnospiraceae bacterium]|nr:2-amino-4-hydroxy-6-hydroxymethyldihydropteridine diphosphokinase [Lachnospiraceae bacterium]